MQNNQEIRLWAKLKKKDKIVRDCVFACPPSQALSEGLIEACRHFDVSVPEEKSQEEAARILADLQRQLADAVPKEER